MKVHHQGEGRGDRDGEREDSMRGERTKRGKGRTTCEKKKEGKKVCGGWKENTEVNSSPPLHTHTLTSIHTHPCTHTHMRCAYCQREVYQDERRPQYCRRTSEEIN